jgi:hypothetical protein
MGCPHCESPDTSERRERTERGYQRFRCRGGQRSGPGWLTTDRPDGTIRPDGLENPMVQTVPSRTVGSEGTPCCRTRCWTPLRR